MAERSPDTGLVRLDEDEGETNEATRVGELDSAQVQELMRQADVREATAVPPLNPPKNVPSSGVVARGERAPGGRASVPSVHDGADRDVDPTRGGPTSKGPRPTHDPEASTVELGGDLVASVLRGVDRNTSGRADSSVLKAAAPVRDDASASPFGGTSEPPPRASMASLPAAPLAPAPVRSSGMGASVGVGVAVFVAITLPALYYLFVR